MRVQNQKLICQNLIEKAKPQKKPTLFKPRYPSFFHRIHHMF